MDNKYTELIKQWLETPSAQRDYSVDDFFLRVAAKAFANTFAGNKK